MASDFSINTDRVAKFFDDLEAQKAIVSSCTQLFTALTSHFTSLQDSLSQKSKSLESKFLSLNSSSQQTLQSIIERESSINERESAAIALINDRKQAALADFEKFAKFTELSESLKLLSRKMDSSGLLKFIISKRKESMTLRAELPHALSESVDPPRLILDAVEELLAQKMEKVGVTDKRWACGMLVQAIFPEGNSGKKVAGPLYARSVLERAHGVLEKWKEQMVDAELGPAEAVMFLQLVVGFGLSSKFDHEFLKKLVLKFSARRDMAKLVPGLGFGDKMGDIIDELVKDGKEIEAVYFASESSLTERFNLVSLIKSYLRNSKKNAITVLKNGNYSNAATEESSNVELNSIKSVIKCVEDHKLESDFSLDTLKKRVSQLEKSKSERKRSTVGNSKPQNKRPRGGGSSSRVSGPSSFRPAKAAKFSNSYQSFSRRNPAPPPPQCSPAARYSNPYNFPNQSVYEGPSPQYSTNYRPPAQNPVAIPQYPGPMDDMAGAGFRGGSSYGGQTAYSAYEYNTSPVAPHQPSTYRQ